MPRTASILTPLKDCARHSPLSALQTRPQPADKPPRIRYCEHGITIYGKIWIPNINSAFPEYRHACHQPRLWGANLICDRPGSSEYPDWPAHRWEKRECAILESGKFLELQNNGGIIAPNCIDTLCLEGFTTVIKHHIFDWKSVGFITVGCRDFNFDSCFAVFVVQTQKFGSCMGASYRQQSGSARKNNFFIANEFEVM